MFLSFLLRRGFLYLDEAQGSRSEAAQHRCLITGAGRSVARLAGATDHFS
jgi:hypothetical protein